jgi:hypothetical protein
MIENTFDFIKDKEKLKLLTTVNELLNLHKSNIDKIVFIYSAPKVGSTSIVSSLRIFAINYLDIIHIHDEEMLNKLGNIKGITINEIIYFNKHLGKTVYVIDIYRSPIERKISAFFEKIGSYHFNNIDHNINNYNINKVINRFNNIFPFIGNGDHFIDKYNIPLPDKFDYDNKFLLVKYFDISYIKLRLKDSSEWDKILSNIFGINIKIVSDYQTNNKSINKLYNEFKNHYKIPINLLNSIKDCKYLNYYYNKEEIQEYILYWSNKATFGKKPYNLIEYSIYDQITMENSHIDYIQFNHYIDEGCKCKACNVKRNKLAVTIINNNYNNEKIIHEEAKTEMIQKQVNQVKKINYVINNIPKKKMPGNLNNKMKNIVNGKNLF